MTASTPDLAALEAEMRARALEAPGDLLDRIKLSWIGGTRQEGHAFYAHIAASCPVNVIAVLDGKDAEIARLRASWKRHFDAAQAAEARVAEADRETARWVDKAASLAERLSTAEDRADASDARASELEVRVAELEARGAGLVEALRPFAEAATRWSSNFDDDTCVDEEGFCLGSLRRARVVLDAPTPRQT